MQLVPVELLFVATQRVTARTMAIYLLWSFLDNRDVQIVHFTIYCYRMSIVSAALCVYLWNPGMLYTIPYRNSYLIVHSVRKYWSNAKNIIRLRRRPLHRNTHPICGIISSTGLNRRTLGWLAFFLKCDHTHHAFPYLRADSDGISQLLLRKPGPEKYFGPSWSLLAS